MGGIKYGKKIKGWFLSGSHPFNYEMGTDHKIVHQGRASEYLQSKALQNSGEFATMMKHFKANRFKGKRIKLSSFIKTKDVKQFSGLWMRVDSSTDDILQFDNMNNRPITGTKNWNHCSLVLYVPENNTLIS